MPDTDDFLLAADEGLFVGGVGVVVLDWRAIFGCGGGGVTVLALIDIGVGVVGVVGVVGPLEIMKSPVPLSFIDAAVLTAEATAAAR